MKRRLALLVCIIATLAMVFALASCGGDECEHTYSTEYTTDANGHWYVATCGCEGEVSNYGAHVDSNNDGKCDTCKYVLCAHTYETEWSTDENNHWNASNCDCTATKANEAKHVDENKDGICDVCKYVMCEHTYSDWKTDETKHWKEATCGCTVANTEEGAHADENKDGNCDTCAYVMCEHTYATEWSTDGAYHWYEATCGCNVVGSKAEHTNEDGDKLCDVCEANICEHTYEETLSSDETHHWYAATCGCDVKKEYAEHTWAIIAEDKLHYTGTTCGCNYTKDVADHADEDEDGKCDTCESDMTLFNVIAGLDQEANAGANNIVVDVDKTVYSDYGDEVIDAETFVKYYKDYAVYKDVDGYTHYYSYYGENGTDLFEIIVGTEGNVSRNEYGEYPVGGATMYISLVYGNVGSYNGNIEEIVSELYNLGAAKDQEYGYSYCFTKSYNEETGAHKFAYVYFEEDKAYEVKVEFTVAENAIATSTIEVNTYYGEDVTVSGNTYTVAEGAAKTQQEKYVIAQTFGDPFDSTDAPNPYPAADYIVTEDYKLGVKDEDGNITEIEKNATVEIDAAKGVYFYFPESLKDVIDFNDINTTVYDSENNESYRVSCYYDSDEKAIFVKSNYAGTYKVVVDVEGVEFTFNINVNYVAPEKINPAVVKGYDTNNVTEYKMYGGKTLIVTATVEAGCDPTFTATIAEDAAATLTLNEDGTYAFTPSAVGDFVITFVSTKAPTVTSTLKVTVMDPPSPGDLLKGEQEYVENSYMGSITVNVVFTPDYEGAASGTVEISYSDENPWETKSFNSKYTYAYSPAGIALTYVEGDNAGFALKFSDDYEVVVTFPPYGPGTESVYLAEYVLKVKAPSSDEEVETTTVLAVGENAVAVTVTNYYCAGTEVTFTATEAGTYTISAAEGENNADVFCIDIEEFIDLPYTFELEEGETISFIIATTAYMTLTEDVINLVIAKAE